jgi:hypothetical protein
MKILCPLMSTTKQKREKKKQRTMSESKEHAKRKKRRETTSGPKTQGNQRKRRKTARSQRSVSKNFVRRYFLLAAKKTQKVALVKALMTQFRIAESLVSHIPFTAIIRAIRDGFDNDCGNVFNLFSVTEKSAFVSSMEYEKYKAKEYQSFLQSFSGSKCWRRHYFEAHIEREQWIAFLLCTRKRILGLGKDVLNVIFLFFRSRLM